MRTDPPGEGGIGSSAVEVSGPGPVVDLGGWFGTLTVERSAQALRIPIQDVVAKIGFANATGSISYQRLSGASITIAFDVHPEREYPDAGSRAELWMQCPTPAPITELQNLRPDAYLVELEVLSPLASLSPGESTSFPTTWTLAAATS